MIMETENQSLDNTPELASCDKGETMAPQDSEGLASDTEMGHTEQKENKDPLQVNSKLEESSISSETIEKRVEQMSADEGTADDAEDGEILEDGEIASDQDGELNEEEEEEGEDKSSSNKSSPTKQRSSGHREEHKRRHERRERHSKRRRTSKEETHKDKQKKKRHKDYDYDKSGEDYDSSWSDTKREKNDKKHDSPSHDSHSEDRHSSKHDKDSDKRRRGSGESKHHGSKDRDRVREKNSADREKPQDRSRDRHERDRGDKADKKDRDRGTRESRKGRGYNDGYESPPGIYDSPSDDEYDASRYAEKKPKFDLEDDMMEMDVEQPMQKGKRKQQQQKKFDRRRQRNEREGDFEEEAPVKKKPLLQTPMEERPVCRFFKEGKCQRGSECPFNHPKRLELCKYHLQSYCRKEGCVFMHEDFPCKYFHTGSTCYQGDNCKFSHDPLTEETETALQNHLKEREDWEEEFGERKHKKKGLLGDQPQLSEQEIQKKLHDMKSIPSIFDIETHKPGESPIKPAPNKGQSPNIRPQGGFPDKGMPQQTGPGGPNVRFNGPPNQGGPPQRPPFMGPPGPGMDGPGMNMQVPPPMVSGPNMSGAPGLMGPGPAPMMSGPGMPGPGMQGPPMGPPMSQAAALVGAILRAAPMLQQYRSQGPNSSVPNAMPGDPRFMGPNMMGQGPNMDGPNMMGPPPNMGGPMMSPGQEGLMGDLQQQQGMMGMGQGQQMMVNQGLVSGMQNDDNSQQQQQQSGQNMGQTNMAGGSNVRDPRKSGAQNDPRLNREQDGNNVDVRSAHNASMADEDFRQDVDMRQDENSSNQGDHTPQQDWDKDTGEGNNEDEDLDIPSHLPPKQREMFMRIRQHTMKMKQEKSAEVKEQPDKQQNASGSMKMDDDKWYSSDEEEDVKPQGNISSILTSLSQPKVSESVPASSVSSSINVMQMINAIKSSNPTNTVASSRPNDPRKQAGQQKPVQREPAVIYSRDGDCPWRLCRVLYVKQRIPDNIDLNDSMYKSDPRVQKILKLQELESGKVIDHSKTVVLAKSEMHKSSSDHRLPDLLDPRVFKDKQNDIPRPELTPFVDPRAGLKHESEQNLKPDLLLQRPQDPRMKPGLETSKPIDPRVQRMTSVPGLPSRPSDPRLMRQDSGSQNAINSGSRPLDPRLARQNSRDAQPGSRGSTPPTDPRMFNRQPSSEPKIMKLENLPSLPLDLGLGVSTVPDPRISKVTETDSLSVHRQTSQPGTSAERDAANGVPKPKLDYRNDPRFKRKRIAEANTSPDISGKRFSGQRKSSTEYSSPLGIDTSQPSEESGYNSYNRPRQTQPQVQSRTQTTANVTNTEAVTSASAVPSVSTDITAHDILDSLQIMPPPGLEEAQGSDKNLKDIFKTIDPTASPFC